MSAASRKSAPKNTAPKKTAPNQKAVTERTAARSKAPDDDLVIGGPPRVDLLPPEVRARKKSRAHRRSLLLGVAGAVALMLMGVGAASLLSLQAQSQLQAEQQRTTRILTEQGKYVGVRKMQEQVTLVQAAQQVGASTEIDWKSYLDSIQATLPANVVVKTVTVDSATPLAIYQQATAPLQGGRVATISFTAATPSFPELPAWLTALRTLPGYADAAPDSATLDTTSGTYTVSITMHVNADAFDERFSAKKGK